jgi:hypothetical protein
MKTTLLPIATWRKRIGIFIQNVAKTKALAKYPRMLNGQLIGLRRLRGPGAATSSVEGTVA